MKEKKQGEEEFKRKFFGFYWLYPICCTVYFTSILAMGPLRSWMTICVLLNYYYWFIYSCFIIAFFLTPLASYHANLLLSLILHALSKNCFPLSVIAAVSQSPLLTDPLIKATIIAIHSSSNAHTSHHHPHPVLLFISSLSLSFTHMHHVPSSDDPQFPSPFWGSVTHKTNILSSLIPSVTCMSVHSHLKHLLSLSHTEQ
jgi:hypothetical protein